MLFLRELKKVVCSAAYVLLVIVAAASLYSQDVFHFGDGRLTRPQPGENYGTVQKEIPEIIMPAALEKLWEEFCANNFRTYPIGFIKNVKLNAAEQDKVAEILSEITDVDKETILALRQNVTSRTGNTDSKNDIFVIGSDSNLQITEDGSFIFAPPGDAADGGDSHSGTGGSPGTGDGHSGAGDSPQTEDLLVRGDMDYSKFKILMQRVDDILGGGSEYATGSLIGFGSVRVTYEEALERYDLFLSRDKVTGGYARLFADYAGAMVMSILPVFPAVLICMKDRRSKMSEIIYTRQASALKVVTVRYLAVITAVMVPVILLSYLSNVPVWGQYGGEGLDRLAPLKYGLGWLMPSAMIVTALGMFLTELTDTPVAVAVQGFWWLFDINAGIRSVSDSYALFRLIPRHNAGKLSCFRTRDYLDNFGRLAANRLLFVGLSMLLVIITVLVYEAKRKGILKGTLYGKFNFKKTAAASENC